MKGLLTGGSRILGGQIGEKVDTSEWPETLMGALGPVESPNEAPGLFSSILTYSQLNSSNLIFLILDI